MEYNGFRILTRSATLATKGFVTGVSGLAGAGGGILMLTQPERLGCCTSVSRDHPGSRSQARPWEILSEANKSLRVTRIQPTEYRFPILRKTFLEQGVGSGLRSVSHWIKTP